MGKIKSIDELMGRHSIIKNLVLPGDFMDGSKGNRYGKVPDKLLAPWSAPTKQDISSNIAPVQFQRIRHDVNLWREAIREAEMAILPFRVRQQRLYVDTVLNPHVQACMLRRKELTLLREFEIIDKSGEVNEEATEFFKQQWFEHFSDLALDSIFYGYSLIQLGDIINGDIQDIQMVRRANISPDRRCVTVFEYAISGINFDDEVYGKWLCYIPTLTEIGISKCGYGLLYKIANYELYLRQLFQQNADYCEMFAHPFRLGKTDKVQGDADHNKLVAMMQVMGSQPWGLIGKNDELDFISDKSGTGWQSYGAFSKMLKDEISKVILGHADAVDSRAQGLGDGKSSESPAKIALDDKQTKDGRMMEHIVKKILIPKLVGLGMRNLENCSIRYKNDNERNEILLTQSSSLKVLGEALKNIKEAGYTIDAEQLTEKSGFTFTIAPIDDNADDGEFGRAKSIQNKINLLYNHKH